MKSFIYFFVLFVTIFCQSHRYSEKLNDEKHWIGSYSFSSKNRDGLKTSFEINIIKLNDITIRYINEDGPPEIYRNLKSDFVDKEKIKINFNPKYEEMGIIFIEKSDKEYNISGKPIYFINPGNDELPLKKIK